MTIVDSYESRLEDIRSHFGEEWAKSIAVNSGWFDLVCDLHDNLVRISPNYKLFQVKQKFGSLRYYAEYVPVDESADNDEAKHKFFDLIYNAESKSMSVCEICGGKGRTRVNGYIVFTMCDSHE